MNIDDPIEKALSIHGLIVEAEDGMEGDPNFEKFSGRLWSFPLVSWEVVLVHPAVEVATCARDHIRGLRPSPPSILEAFKVREVFMSLRPESLLLEHGDSSRLWSMIGGFNSVLDIEGACILSTTPIGVRVLIRLFLSLKTEFSSNTESWSFLTFKMSVNRNFKKSIVS